MLSQFVRTENQNQMSFYPFVPHEISILVELILQRLSEFRGSIRTGCVYPECYERPPLRIAYNSKLHPREGAPSHHLL